MYIAGDTAKKLGRSISGGLDGRWKTIKAIFKYPGSKWRLADWIIQHFPPDYPQMAYIEPFFGSGAVFFNKRPSVSEIINDIDSEVVNFFKVLREQPEELKRLLELTPYSREEYDKAFETVDDPLEAARRFIIKANQAIGGKMAYKAGWRRAVSSGVVGGVPCTWGNITNNITAAATRLRGTPTNMVQFEHTDALKLIEWGNAPDVLMYIDPPYLTGTRRGGRVYKHEMSDDLQRKMLDLITCSKAKIIISGYASEMYDNALAGWHRDTATARTTSTSEAQEVIWQNFAPPAEQMKLDF